MAIFSINTAIAAKELIPIATDNGGSVQHNIQSIPLARRSF
ncbi:MAG: hypothetical protein NVV82_26945 [Sporocytophaga sp.]|nr:hypothetical protein [Sporocytophaga sp.]